ncbi:MAG: hypothetical protein ACJAWV_004293, partial [Flammeovirgaceae bacterium]
THFDKSRFRWIDFHWSLFSDSEEEVNLRKEGKRGKKKEEGGKICRVQF